MVLQAGSTLGPYTIDHFAGRGGLGEVYRARDTRNGRFVALKVLSRGLTTHSAQFARFRRDAHTGSLLNHPNIAAVHEIGSIEGLPIVASEWLNGSSLRCRLSAGKLSVGTAVGYALQIASGLSAAHAMGVAHRAIKPENLFVTADGCVKIVDFGLAKCWHEALEVLQSDGPPPDALEPVLGNIRYLSPEQVRGEEADHRSDIFSLGVVLFEMLTRKVPFRGRSAIETLDAILRDQPRWVSVDAGDCGRALDRVLRRSLEKDPDERFQSARDLAYSLDLVVPAPREGGSSVAAPSSPRFPLPHSEMQRA